MTRYRWVAARKVEGFPTTAACEIADVSRQAFYDWLQRETAGPTEAELAEADLVQEIREIHDEFDESYGSPRITAELRDRGRQVNHKRIERLMRVHGIVGVHKPAKVRTTIPAEDAAPLPDLVRRNFAPGVPDVAWVGDISYIPTGQGWLYLATVIDLGSRRLLGYAMAEHMRTELVTDALAMAAGVRGGATDGIIFHSDRGAQYLAGDYRQAVAGRGMIQSAGRTGVLGQLRGRIVLQLTQARADPPLPVRRPRRRPPSDLRLDQPLQHPEAALEPRIPFTHHLGEPAPLTQGRSGRVNHVTGPRGEAQGHCCVVRS